MDTTVSELASQPLDKSLDPTLLDLSADKLVLASEETVASRAASPGLLKLPDPTLLDR